MAQDFSKVTSATSLIGNVNSRVGCSHQLIRSGKNVTIIRNWAQAILVIINIVPLFHVNIGGRESVVSLAKFSL